MFSPIAHLVNSDTFATMVIAEYARDVARCEYYAYSLEYILTPETEELYLSEYLTYDECAFKRANIMGHELACQIAGYVLRDIRDMGLTQAMRMYDDVARKAMNNWRLSTGAPTL